MRCGGREGGGGGVELGGLYPLLGRALPVARRLALRCLFYLLSSGSDRCLYGAMVCTVLMTVPYTTTVSLSFSRGRPLVLRGIRVVGDPSHRAWNHPHHGTTQQEAWPLGTGYYSKGFEPENRQLGPVSSKKLLLAAWNTVAPISPQNVSGRLETTGVSSIPSLLARGRCVGAWSRRTLRAHSISFPCRSPEVVVEGCFVQVMSHCSSPCLRGTRRQPDVTRSSTNSPAGLPQ